MTAANPFVDATRVSALYQDADRIARRTGSLHRAKTAGRPVADVIVDLAERYLDRYRRISLVADVGCGRGSSTRTLAEELGAERILGVDASAAVLTAARERPGHQGENRVSWLCADFHHLPLATATCDLVVAAFCLYHSSGPATVVSELARCLRPGGVAVLVTKSLDSYRSLDELVASSGLDPDACRRPSLYGSAHSGNLASLAARSLTVRRVEHEDHQFTFSGLAHVAEYLVTNPKYAFSASLRRDTSALTGALRAQVPDRPVATTSQVTYVIAQKQEMAP